MAGGQEFGFGCHSRHTNAPHHVTCHHHQVTSRCSRPAVMMRLITHSSDAQLLPRMHAIDDQYQQDIYIFNHQKTAILNCSPPSSKYGQLLLVQNLHRTSQSPTGAASAGQLWRRHLHGKRRPSSRTPQVSNLSKLASLFAVPGSDAGCRLFHLLSLRCTAEFGAGAG